LDLDLVDLDLVREARAEPAGALGDLAQEWEAPVPVQAWEEARAAELRVVREAALDPEVEPQALVLRGEQVQALRDQEAELAVPAV
jgi:hypothetical protein